MLWVIIGCVALFLFYDADKKLPLAREAAKNQ